MSRAQKEPCNCLLVEKYMRGHDEFITARNIREALKMGASLVSACLCSLRNYKVVECMQEGKVLWWYALPADMDTRMHVLKERTPETKPRRLRRCKCA